MEYSKKNLKRMYDNYNEFEQEWFVATSKKEFIEHLLGEGVMVDALFDRVNDNIDVFDLLSNVAFDIDVICFAPGYYSHIAGLTVRNYLRPLLETKLRFYICNLIHITPLVLE